MSSRLTDYVRYYVTEIVDGQPKRVQRSKWLCKKDNKHHSRTCEAVKQLAAVEIVNGESGVTQADISVTDFWDMVYFPHIEKTTKPSTRPSNPRNLRSESVDFFSKRNPTLAGEMLVEISTTASSSTSSSLPRILTQIRIRNSVSTLLELFRTLPSALTPPIANVAPQGGSVLTPLAVCGQVFANDQEFPGDLKRKSMSTAVDTFSPPELLAHIDSGVGFAEQVTICLKASVSATMAKIDDTKWAYYVELTVGSTTEAIAAQLAYNCPSGATSG